MPLSIFKEGHILRGLVIESSTVDEEAPLIECLFFHGICH
jgi:hypothetical protein